MENLAWYQIIAIVYLSLWIFKLIIVAKDFSFIARTRVANSTIEIPDGWSAEGITRLAYILYFWGAAAMLIPLLIPTLYKEGFTFFKSYPKNEILYFAINNKWRS